MRLVRTAIALTVLLAAGAVRAEAATLQVTLALDGFKEIEIPIATPPGEFDALQTAWGRVLFNGAVVAYYMIDVENKTHSGSLVPTNYPDPWIRIAIRTIGAGSELLLLEGTARPLAAGGGTFGGVTVATPGLSFLRFASFTSVSGPGGLTVTFTY